MQATPSFSFQGGGTIRNQSGNMPFERFQATGPGSAADLSEDAALPESEAAPAAAPEAAHATLRATLARLRIAGFKSFAEPTVVEVLPGLTGIVGPNGCGKSNVVEALRWAMGETSRPLHARRRDGRRDLRRHRRPAGRATWPRSRSTSRKPPAWRRRRMPRRRTSRSSARSPAARVRLSG